VIEGLAISNRVDRQINDFAGAIVLFQDERFQKFRMAETNLGRERRQNERSGAAVTKPENRIQR
jgi:hypothetical protein